MKLANIPVVGFVKKSTNVSCTLSSLDFVDSCTLVSASSVTPIFSSSLISCSTMASGLFLPASFILSIAAPPISKRLCNETMSPDNISCNATKEPCTPAPLPESLKLSRFMASISNSVILPILASVTPEDLLAITKFGKTKSISCKLKDEV